MLLADGHRSLSAEIDDRCDGTAAGRTLVDGCDGDEHGGIVDGGCYHSPDGGLYVTVVVNIGVV